MKTNFTIILICLSSLAFGQDYSNLGKTFVLKGIYSADICDAVGSPTNGSRILLENYIVNVLHITTTGYVIKLLEFKNKDSLLNERFVKASNVEIYYLIPFKDFANYFETLPAKNSLMIGIPTIPVKIRFGNNGMGDDPRYFRFEGNISLGLSVGFKHALGKKNQYAYNIVFGFTTASVPVDSVTTKGKVNSTTSAASFSPHIGFVFDIQNFQCGLYTGIDYLNGEPNKYWVYRNDPWLGIGIGYNLFRSGGTAKQD